MQGPAIIHPVKELMFLKFALVLQGTARGSRGYQTNDWA